MANIPRNLRSKTPRPVRAVCGSNPDELQHSFRWGATPTPTPPPVAVSTTAPSGEDEGIPLEPAPDETTPGLGIVGAATLVGWLALSAFVVWHLADGASMITMAREHVASLTRQTAAAAVVTGPAAPPLAAQASAQPAASAATPSAPSAVADSGLKHEGYEPLHGGVLIAPDTFAPGEDGSFDLAIHFHGDVAIVRESYERAGVNAALAIINLGVGSAAYRDAYLQPGLFEALVAQIRRRLQARGVATPKLKRMALTGWSAGYGAIESILTARQQPPRDKDPLDALVIFDGIHCGYMRNEPTRINTKTLMPFVRAARAAAEGQIMFLMTHSEIDPKAYVSTTKTASHLLASVGVEAVPSPMTTMPAEVDLAAAPPKERMVPTADTSVGMFRVRGFRGHKRAHHAAHLTQMAAVGLDELAARWR